MFYPKAMVVSKEDTIISTFSDYFCKEFPSKQRFDNMVKKLYQMYTDMNPLYKIGGIKRFLKKNIIQFQIFEIVNKDAFDVDNGDLSQLLHQYCPEINTEDDLYDPRVLDNYSFDERKRICELAVSYRFYLYDYANEKIIEVYEVAGDDIIYANRSNIKSDYKPKYVPGQRIHDECGNGTIQGIPEDAIPFSYVMWSPELYCKYDERDIQCQILQEENN